MSSLGLSVISLKMNYIFITVINLYQKWATCKFYMTLAFLKYLKQPHFLSDKTNIQRIA